MKIRLAIIVLAVAVLAGCKSDVTPVSFYMLGSPSTLDAGKSDVKSQGTVVLERVVLSEYLRQSGLVLQTGPNQLQVSKTHLWAEALDLALPKVLLRELERQWPQYRFYLASDFVPKADYRLRLNVDSFHIHMNGEVLAEGKFQLINVTKDSNSTYPFRVTRELHEDGYPYAVSQLQTLTNDMAALIGKQLQQESAP